ncbi:hypothetical protein ACP4OV_002705 [Aristida adscensionis]
MSRLAAAALRRGVAASRAPNSSSLVAPFAPVSARLFSADASGEAAAGAGAADSQEDSFLKASREGLAYGRFYSVIAGGNRLGKDMLKTDIIHQLDRSGLTLDDVKIDYNRGYNPMGAGNSSSKNSWSWGTLAAGYSELQKFMELTLGLLRFPSKASFTTAARQTTQSRLYRLEEISRDEWDLKQSFNEKAVLLQGVPRNALPEDIERFLCGTNFEPPPFESFLSGCPRAHKNGAC